LIGAFLAPCAQRRGGPMSGVRGRPSYRCSGAGASPRRTAESAMKVTVERAALMKSLGHVHRVVERRTTIPILGNVLLRADAKGLRLQATDLDLETVETVPSAEVVQP